MRMGKYEMGRTLGEGHFGKVRLARHADNGRAFAIKILDRQRILAMKIDEQVRAPSAQSIDRLFPGFFRLACLFVAMAAQIKTEIATLKLLKHPNVVRLYEVRVHAFSPKFFPPQTVRSIRCLFSPGFFPLKCSWGEHGRRRNGLGTWVVGWE